MYANIVGKSQLKEPYIVHTLSGEPIVIVDGSWIMLLVSAWGATHTCIGSPESTRSGSPKEWELIELSN